MNGEIEERKSQTMVLLIINSIIWIPIIIFILFMIGISRVEAYSYRIRIMDLNNTQCVDSNTTSAQCDNLSIRSLITMNFGQTYTSGTKIYINYNYTYAQRIWYGSRTLWQDINIYQVYGVDSGGNVHDITNNCNQGKDYRVSKTGTGINDTELRQYFVTGVCELTPTYNITSILFEPKMIYQENPVVSPVTQRTAISINDFEVTDQAGMEEQIINNATNNAINIINNANNNTTQIMENTNARFEEMKNAVHEEFNTCNTYDFNNNQLNGDGLFYTANGDLTYFENWYHTSDYISVNQNKTYTLTFNYNPGSARYCLYDKDKNKIGDCISYNSQNTININTGNAYYIRYSGNKYSSNQTYFTGEYCFNYLESIEDSMYWNKASQPSSGNSDLAYGKEEQLLDSIDDINFDDFSMNFNNEAVSTIWDLVYRVLFTNVAVGGVVITLLSLGILRLVLRG